MAAIICAYVLGAIPGSSIVAARHGVDLRTTSDGNPGAWNALEQLGWRRAWPAFAIDGLKGTAAVALGWLVLGELPWAAGAQQGDDWLPWACGAAAMLGHAFPPLPGRRGGKAVMTFAGCALAIEPVVGLPLTVAWVWAMSSGRGRAGSLLVVFAFPLLQLLPDPPFQVAWTGALMTLVGALFLLRRGDRRITTRAPTPR